jgi:PAS domain S-box-containing protein
MDTANAPTIDAKGLLVNECNKTVEITTFKSQEVVGRDLVQEFITEEYRESVRAVIDDALRGKETANFEFALNTKDKRRVDVLLNATTGRDLSGGVIVFFFLGQLSLCKRICFCQLGNRPYVIICLFLCQLLFLILDILGLCKVHPILCLVAFMDSGILDCAVAERKVDSRFLAW